jgi:hypothetical protein
VPLPILKEVTTALRLKVVMGCVLKVTVKLVGVAAVTIPAAPLLKAMVLLAKVVSNPVPVMIIVGALMARFAALVITVGATGVTIAAT